MRLLDVTTNRELEPDWSCYEGRDAGAHPGAKPDAGDDGAARSATFRLSFFPYGGADPTGLAMMPALVEGVAIDFFFGASTAGVPDATRTVAPGAYSVMLDVPAGVATASVRIREQVRDDPSFTIVEMREYDLPISAAGTFDGFTMLQASYRLSATLVLDGQQPDPELAALQANARDCRERDVGGAQFELIDGETGELVASGSEPGGPRGAYSRFALLDATCSFTNPANASWVLLNAPVNMRGDVKTRSYRLRLKGRMRESDREPVILGEREVELFAGTTSLVRAYRVTPP